MTVTDTSGFASDAIAWVEVFFPPSVSRVSTASSRGNCSIRNVGSVSCSLGLLADLGEQWFELTVKVNTVTETVFNASVKPGFAQPSLAVATTRVNAPAAPPPSPDPPPPPDPAPAFPNGVSRTGSSGADRLEGTPYRDRLDGRGGPDTVIGLGGDDTLIGGAGRDTLRGGSGRDLIRARDGFPDAIRCGDGLDTVHADRIDRASPDCEDVRLP